MKICCHFAGLRTRSRPPSRGGERPPTGKGKRPPTGKPPMQYNEFDPSDRPPSGHGNRPPRGGGGVQGPTPSAGTPTLR
mgnify:CR=1 FL=1